MSLSAKGRTQLLAALVACATGMALLFAVLAITRTKKPVPVAAAREVYRPPPTPPAAPLRRVGVEFAVKITPIQARVGDKIVIDLRTKNLGAAPIHGFRALVKADWDDFTFNGAFGGREENRLLSRRAFLFPTEIPPGETRGGTLVLHPVKPGNHPVEAKLRSAEEGVELVDTAGAAHELEGEIVVNP